MGKAKPFDIPKREVWEAFKRVKANQGAAGVDAQSIAEFEGDLSNNLYKLWNRLSSGSYLPPPVRRVEIPKADGGTRPLGIPTVADRIAQEVARRYLEPYLEPVFHTDSYSYRPGRSAYKSPVAKDDAQNSGLSNGGVHGGCHARSRCIRLHGGKAPVRRRDLSANSGHSGNSD